MEDLAVVNGLRRFIYKKGKAPEYMDKFDKKADEIKLVVWQAWETGDLSMKIIIKLNVKSTPVQILAGYKLAYKMWTIL
jgi:hypothetical protein